MKTKVEQTEAGCAVTITDDEGNASRWGMEGDQIEKHMQGMGTAGHPFKGVKKGDLSAARDMANESRKQLES